MKNKMQTNQGTINHKVLYAKAVFGKEEKNAVMQSLENGFLASGPLVKQFEEEVAKRFGKKYGIAVNSGSSANLLAVAALKLPKGNKVITPGLTFATTVSEIVYNGLVPVFVDGVIGRYTIDEAQIESVIDDKTSAIMIPQLIGGICDMVKIRSLADKHNLKIIDDCCDTFSPSLHGKTVASYADVTTTSFYGSHIITACGVGGMLMTDDEKVRDVALTLRDWGRVGNDSEEFKSRFDFEIDGIPYDAKFLYSELGYNLKMNEASAAFGLEQLKKLPEFFKTRKENFNKYLELLKPYKHIFYLPELIDGADTAWLALPLTIRQESGMKRYDLLQYLEKQGIQTRVLFSGNITRHPIYKSVKFEVASDMKNADYVMQYGFLLGSHHGMTLEDVEYVCSKIGEFIKNGSSSLS